MHLQWLDDVLVLLEEGNMTRAAARRNITQPAFSRRIRGFEAWLGRPVLDRGKNRIEMTNALTQSEGDIRHLVQGLRELRDRIAHFDPARTTITVAAQHATVYSCFPDIAVRARHLHPRLGFRLRAANLRDCVSLLLRRDADMLLCYDTDEARPLPFDTSIRREVWSTDYLVPVVGGSLRYSVRDGGKIDTEAPSIIYPDTSHFGSVLARSARPFGTRAQSRNPVCETAFSSGIKELVIKGLGVGWLPFSIVHREIENGDLISLSNQLGQERLEVAIYADATDEIASPLLDIFANQAVKR